MKYDIFQAYEGILKEDEKNKPKETVSHETVSAAKEDNLPEEPLTTPIEEGGNDNESEE